MSPRAISASVLLAAGALAVPGSAFAYEERVHQLIGERALPATLPRDLARPTMVDVDELRGATWRAGASHPDPGVRARFLARYASQRQFDGWAWKELLGLTPEAQVVGIDLLPEAGQDARAVAAFSSRAPDDDKRNVERFAHDRDRRVRRDAAGQPLPADPAQLDMGALTGLSSQAHAHYGLPALQFSDSPEVLEKDPRRFAFPPTATAFAPEFAQMHTDLAIAAATSGTAGGQALSWIWLGAAHHYLEDLANQVHTLQAVYPFFVDAKLQSWKENALSLWGFLRPRPGFVEIGLGIIKNHHLFLEDLWGARSFDAAEGRPAPAGATAGLAALAAGDAQMEAALDARALTPSGSFSQAIAEELVEVSSREGADVYLAARDIANPRLSRSRYVYQAGTADSELRASPDPVRLARFYELEAKGFARAATAVRRHVRLFQAETARAEGSEGARLAVRDAALHRLVASSLDAMDAREARLSAWLASGAVKPR